MAVAATCAGCMRPIPKGSAMVIEGTEVFHRACVPLIASSHATRLRVRVSELAASVTAQAADRLEIERLRRQVRELEAQVADTSRSAENWKRLRDLATRDRDTLQQTALERGAELDAAMTREREARLENSRLARLVEERTRERDAARAEAAAPKDAAPAATTAEDATAIRFSLLELDLQE